MQPVSRDRSCRAGSRAEPTRANLRFGMARGGRHDLRGVGSARLFVNATLDGNAARTAILAGVGTIYADGNCFTATYSGASVLQSKGAVFKARTP